MACSPQAILGRMEQRWRFDVEASGLQILAGVVSQPVASAK